MHVYEKKYMYFCSHRSSTACGQDRTNNIDLAISLVTDKENRLTLDRLESFKKVDWLIFPISSFPNHYTSLREIFK